MAQEAGDHAIAPRNTALLADFLHGVIAATPLERFITSTPAFNRLHDVKQNSTAFLTYPSMVHSRFAHSLGTMHLASRMFVNAFGNAAVADRTRFLAGITKIVRGLCVFGTLVKSNERPYRTWDTNRIQDALRKGAFRAHQVYKSAPPELATEQLVAYCVALQAIRVAALVHDLGHPPFSHVTEFAIEELSKEATQGELRGHRRALHEVFGRAKVEGKKLHELLTLDLFDDLRALIDQEEAGRNFTDITDHIFARMSMATAQGILQDGRMRELGSTMESDSAAALRCLRSLEDGDLDADRFDYVQRDVLMAGIRERGYRDERLISLLRLVYVPCDLEDDTSAEVPAIVPSVRSLRSLEEFYEWRSELYRTVIYHHHVVRTDSLFQDLIRQQCTAILDEAPSADEHLSADRASLHWLWTIYQHRAGADRKMDIYLQWDDHWLMAVLRRRYLNLKQELEGHETQPGREGQLIELRRLEEIVASKKNYISVVKRFEHYRPIDKSFVDEWKQLFSEWVANPANHQQTETARALERADAVLRSEQPVDNGSLPWDEPGSEMVFERIWSFGFEHMKSSAVQLSTREIVERVMNSAIGRVKNDLGLLDVFWKNKPYKGAMGASFRVLTDSGVERLGRHSNLLDELKMKAKRSPQHFFYVLPRDSQPLDVADIRSKLGRCLAIELFAFVTKE